MLSKFEQSKEERDNGLEAVKADAAEAIATLKEDDAVRQSVSGSSKLQYNWFKALTKKLIRQQILKDGKRVDGRGLDEVRQISAMAGVLPRRVHGSGRFQRGLTQVLSTATLGTPSDAQEMDDLHPTTEKLYLHHYNFPPYSVGETRPMRSPGRREIGHGALAERAILPVLPEKDTFPYVVRVVSEVLSSNGSTSMGSGSTFSSTCSAATAAGVPPGSLVREPWRVSLKSFCFWRFASRPLLISASRPSSSSVHSGGVEVDVGAARIAALPFEQPSVFAVFPELEGTVSGAPRGAFVIPATATGPKP